MLVLICRLPRASSFSPTLLLRRRRAVSFGLYAEDRSEQVRTLLTGIINRSQDTLSGKTPEQEINNNVKDAVLDVLSDVREQVESSSEHQSTGSDAYQTNNNVKDALLDVLSRVRQQVESSSEQQSTGSDAYQTNNNVKDAVVDVLSRVRQQVESSDEQQSTGSDAYQKNVKDDVESSSGTYKFPTAAPDILPRPTDTKKYYGRNPTVTSTALAHSLWSYILRPHVDTAIDATAGNGGDALALAQMLFPDATDYETTSKAHLLCIDIQEQACEKTRQKLASFLPADVMHRNVQIVHASHAPLPHVDGPVALVVYNLGYLPGDSSLQTTTTESTIISLADASLRLRVGGMLSIMTYPRTNPQEDAAVRAFCEGLALFSSSTHDWEDAGSGLQELVLVERLRDKLRYVLDQGGSSQTWRVHEHKKLGWIDAPILLTATRIS
jgi:hypothetical protein